MVALLNSHRFDEEIHSKLTIIGLFLLFKNYLDIFEVISC